jgi:dihydrodipicolinate synthase/N-acetylneuraminate lyase
MRLEGIWPALATPLNADESVNRGALRHYRALVEEGGLPAVLDNIPGCTKVMLERERLDH